MVRLRRKYLGFNHRARYDLIAFSAVGNNVARGFERSFESLLIFSGFYRSTSIQEVRELVSIHFQLAKIFTKRPKSDRVCIVRLMKGDFGWFSFITDKCSSRARVTLVKPVA
jgi:hypothetical protein